MAYQEERGRSPGICRQKLREEDIQDFSGVRGDLEYSQALKPPVKRDEAVGHAVRKCICAPVLIWPEKMPIRGLWKLAAIWENMTTRRMYITGGIRKQRLPRAVTTDYDLPKRYNYSETCIYRCDDVPGRNGSHLGSASYYDYVKALYNL